MTVGLAPTKADVDNLVGSLTAQVEGAFGRVQTFKAWLDAQTDATLQAAPYGYTSGEVATLRSALTDLDQLRAVYQGTATRTPAYDYRTFAKLLMGFGGVR